MKIESMIWLMLLASSCGPQVADDEDAGAAAGQDHGDAYPAEAPCGERQLSCAGGLGECIDGKCAPAPTKCVIESDREDTCMDACARHGDGVICAENGCDDATAFGYPGTEVEAISVCGEGTPEVQDAVVPIEMPCDAPLRFTGEGSFALYQCCCDHPDF